MNITKALRTTLVAAFSFCAISAHAATPAEVFYLDSYDQLTAKSGQKGLWLVRDAAGLISGHHGDPRVKYGWALYTWDGSLSVFKMISKQEVLEVEWPDLSKYVPYTVYTPAMVLVNNNIATNTLNIAKNTADIEELKGGESGLGTRVTALEVRAATNDVDIAYLYAKTAAQDVTISNNAVIASNYTDTKTAAERTYVDDTVVPAINTSIANTLTSAKSYADDQVAAAKIDVITNTAIRVHALETRLTNKINQVEINTKAFATSEAVSYAASAKEDANTFTTNRVAIALDSAKSYADDKKSEAITSANAYTDEKVKNVNSNILVIVDTKDAAVLRQAKEYTDSKDPGTKSYVQEQIAAVSNNVVAIASADATFKANDAKVYAIDKDGVVMRYADANDLVVSNAAIAAVGAAKTELTGSINTVDARVTEVETFAKAASNNVLVAANKYTDETKSALEGSITSAKSEAISEAVNAAASDASTKTNAVYGLSKDYADGRYVAATNEAISHVDGMITVSDLAALAAKTTNLATKKDVSDAATLVCPITLKKGDQKYKLDIIDNGEDDITLKITRE